jgi:hypothetical protein
MRAFDRLPKTVRRALTDSQFNWNVESLLQMWRERRMNARQLVRQIQTQDRERLLGRMS